jgi:hypothetical protein
METKLCCICKITKNLTEFSKNRSRRDGHNTFCKSCGSDYHRNHRDHYNELAVTRRANNPTARISNKLRLRINAILTKNVKSSATADIIGIDQETFLEWISYQFTPEMNYGNYGTIWNFDHIIPMSHFNLLDETELKKCMHFTNIQPILVIKNREKFNHIDLDLSIAQEVKAEYFLEMLELNRIDPPDFYS